MSKFLVGHTYKSRDGKTEYYDEPIYPDEWTHIPE